MSFPLTKTLDPERDYVELAPELVMVDQHFYKAAEQHPHRRFEYAMALRALNVWMDQRKKQPFNLYDVGGAGSPFRYMPSGEQPVCVIDPAEPESYTLEQFVTAGTELADAVFCLSVLEHVEDLDQVLYHLSCLVAPGGLLFLTMDCCDDVTSGWPVDSYHFHWMRKRIFNWWALGWTLGKLDRWGCTSVGEIALELADFHPAVYDYSFASLALVKRT